MERREDVCPNSRPHTSILAMALLLCTVVVLGVWLEKRQHGFRDKLAAANAVMGRKTLVLRGPPPLEAFRGLLACHSLRRASRIEFFPNATDEFLAETLKTASHWERVNIEDTAAGTQTTAALLALPRCRMVNAGGSSLSFAEIRLLLDRSDWHLTWADRYRLFAGDAFAEIRECSLTLTVARVPAAELVDAGLAPEGELLLSIPWADTGNPIVKCFHRHGLVVDHLDHDIFVADPSRGKELRIGLHPPLFASPTLEQSLVQPRAHYDLDTLLGID